MPEQVVSIRPSVRDNGIMAIDDMLCMHCGACVGTCPTYAIFLNDVYLTFNEDCTQCGMCVKVCPVGAIDYPRGHKLHTMKSAAPPRPASTTSYRTIKQRACHPVRLRNWTTSTSAVKKRAIPRSRTIARRS